MMFMMKTSDPCHIYIYIYIYRYRLFNLKKVEKGTIDLEYIGNITYIL